MVAITFFLTGNKVADYLYQLNQEPRNISNCRPNASVHIGVFNIYLFVSPKIHVRFFHLCLLNNFLIPTLVSATKNL